MGQTENGSSPLKNGEYLVLTEGGVSKRLTFQEQGSVSFDGAEPEPYDILSGDIRSGHFTLLFRNRVYHVHAEPSPDGLSNGGIAVRLNGKAWQGTVDDRRSQLARRFGTGPGGPSGETVIKAPMPGMVLRVLVKPGDNVQRDDGLIILEAMKMENEVRADHPGRVVKVECAEGKPVDKNARLITIHYEH